MYPKSKLAQLILLACNKFKIQTAVISPGSRNAPLIIGFTGCSKLNAYSIVDERCASFFALGIAQQKQKPVILLCTSGTALLNYYPAIAEAFYSHIPLVIISADRPEHLIDIGEGQAIKQQNVFAKHVLFSANLIDTPDMCTHNAELVCQAFSNAITHSKPVHINIPFDEPLYQVINTLDLKITKSFNSIYQKAAQVFKQKTKPIINYKKLADLWNASKKKIILIGLNYPSAKLEEVIKIYAEDASVLILTETTSNIHGSCFINSIDQLITPLSDKEFKELRPNILLSIGGLIISKRIKAFFRKYQPAEHWYIDKRNALDTYFCLSESIKEDPVNFMTNFLTHIKQIKSNYKTYWLSVKKQRSTKHESYLKKIAFSDLKVMQSTLQSIPEHCQLQLGNSTVVRYAQLFKLKPTLKVFCNRGTSGIDGCTSTAVGAALSSEVQTVLITGDISFYYDSNALWNMYIPKSFRIIIVNNSGGGIFKIISGPQSTKALEYFETPHQLNAENLAKTYGFEYRSANNSAELAKALNDFYQLSSRPKILEIFTPTNINDTILKQYFAHL
ncbi:MAG: 2-succinyl-5-enolpyruvyl-6-hydroxy-3-cyclohexene-1-carboxylic-acid synthase [Tenacibaculum sp.]